MSTPDNMVEANAAEILSRLEQLRTELVELAYTLDTRGQLGAADIAITTSARIAELCDEFASARPVSLVQWLEAAALGNTPLVAPGAASTPPVLPG